jgi:hypothetical protein
VPQALGRLVISLSRACLRGARGRRGRRYLFYRPGTPSKEIEVALLAHLEVHGTLTGTRLEGCRLVRRGIQLADPARAEIREEVVSCVVGSETERRGVVEGAAGDRAARILAEAVPVGEERLLGVGVVLGAFEAGPAVVGAGLSFVDLLPGFLADVLMKILPVSGWTSKL